MMRKKLLLMLFVCLCGAITHAQEMFQGSNLLSIGVGALPGIGVNFAYDYGLLETNRKGVLTIGGFAGSDSRTESTDQGRIRYTHAKWLLAFRTSYRYPIAPKWELYGAAMMGIILERFRYNIHYNAQDPRQDENHLGFALTAGVRRCIADHFSIFTEFGYNVSYVSLGLSFQF